MNGRKINYVIQMNYEKQTNQKWKLKIKANINGDKHCSTELKMPVF